MSDTIKIDAEYMNAWLGEASKINSLSSKVLFDIKTLIEYYKDIIVPQKEVAVSFPVEGKNSSPRASVERGEVLIPYYMLKDGEIDNTIGAMIHELHHIKLSASERFLTAVTFKFLRQLMEQIECGSMTMAERLFSDASVTADRIMGWDGDPLTTTNDMMFLRQAIGDLMFMLNAVEDVRIDANTPPNLRKYIDKLEKQASVRILDSIAKGDLNNDLRDINSISFMLLVHHKDIHQFPFIEDRYGDTNAIVSSDALELPLSVFTAFKDEIATHLLKSYTEFCGPPPTPSKDSEGNEELDLDAYFGSKVKSTVGEALETQFDEDIEEEEGKALKGIGENIKDVNVSTDIAPHTEGTQAKEGAPQGTIDLSEKKGIVRDWSKAEEDSSDDTPFDGRELREQIEADAKPVYLDPLVVTQINSFKNVQVITTSEQFDDKTVVYDSVLFDAIN